MKQFFYLTIVLLFVVVNNVQSHMSPEDAEQFLVDTAACKNTTGASDQDIEDLYIRNLPTTKAGKCLNECLFNKLGIFKDGKFAQDGLVKMVEMDRTDLKGKGGKTMKESVNEIIGDCSAVADPDTCELAAKLRSCWNAAAKKREFCANVF